MSCPLNPPNKLEPYCNPAPFQSVTNEKYFLVREAYGGLPNGTIPGIERLIPKGNSKLRY